MTARDPKKPPPKKRGPKPDRLALEGDWEEAVGKALKKAPPPVRPPAKRKAP